MAEAGCARPTGGPMGEPEEVPEEKLPEDKLPQGKKEERPMIAVGKAAPDFTAPAYYRGEFTSTQLSKHLGKWIVLCFYPGDFTFV